MAGDARSDRRHEPELDGSGVRVGVVAARFNDLVTYRLLEGVDRGLIWLGADPAVVEWVPGAFEIPLAAKAYARSGRVDAVIGVGCVIRGETTHYEVVAGECAAGILRAGLDTGVPVIFSVLTTETLDQALARSEGPGGHNVGEESAATAVEMVHLLARIRAGDAPEPKRLPKAARTPATQQVQAPATEGSAAEKSDEPVKDESHAASEDEAGASPADEVATPTVTEPKAADAKAADATGNGAGPEAPESAGGSSIEEGSAGTPDE